MKAVVVKVMVSGGGGGGGGSCGGVADGGWDSGCSKQVAPSQSS